MPRIEADSTELSPENGAPPSRFTFGVSADRRVRSLRPFDCSASAVNAVIAIGTSWTFSLRFCAVTMTSSRPSALATPVASAAVIANAAKAAADLPRTN